MAHYVDMHAHYLAGIDDGAETVDMGVEMVHRVCELGFMTLIATPHQRAGMYMPSANEIQDARAALVRAVDEANGTSPNSPRIELAAENYWDDVFQERLTTKKLPSYPGDRAFLFEVPTSVMPVGIDQTLFQIRVSGQLPVMAHPERYREIQSDLGRAEALGRSAALLVDLGAVAGAYGRIQKKTARKMLMEGLAHAVATDVHKPADARAAAKGMAWIDKKLGRQTLDTLLEVNPRHILSGSLP